MADPDLARDLAGAAARSPRSTWCVTVTDSQGHAIGHGCARPAPVNPSFTFTPAGQPGPPGGYGTWRFSNGLPGQRDLLLDIGPIPTEHCDHRHQANGHDPGVMLRHPSQVRHTSIPGFGDVVAQAWLGEIGPAPHRHFAMHEKRASWVTLCPGNNISARKRKHGRTGDAGTYIKPMLVQAAWATIRVRGRLQARYSRLVRRFGGDKNPAAKQAWLERQLQKLHPGCTITITITIFTLPSLRSRSGAARQREPSFRVRAKRKSIPQARPGADPGSGCRGASAA